MRCGSFQMDYSCQIYQKSPFVFFGRQCRKSNHRPAAFPARSCPGEQSVLLIQDLKYQLCKGYKVLCRWCREFHFPSVDTGSSVAPISKSEIMVEIHWKDGTSSLVKVDSAVHQAMIVGMYNDVTQTQQAQTAQKDTKTRDASTAFGYILFFACTAIYLFAEFAK